jgi:hypothetical protein
MRSIHDSVLVGYDVDGERRMITLHTKPHEGGGGEEPVDVVFHGVVAYHIEGDCLANIVASIDEVAVEDVLGDGKEFAERHRITGWPRGWNPDRESAQAFFSRTGVKLYGLICSYGMSAWFAASSMEQLEPGRGVTTVNYDELSNALDFVSGKAPFEHRAYVSRDTGAIHWITEDNAVEEDLPNDLETSDRYIAIPDKNELDLGNELVGRFVEARLAHRRETVADLFRRRGGYARFKELLETEGCLEEWYAFEERAKFEALRDWTTKHNIRLDRSQT